MREIVVLVDMIGAQDTPIKNSQLLNEANPCQCFLLGVCFRWLVGGSNATT